MLEQPKKISLVFFIGLLVACVFAAAAMFLLVDGNGQEKPAKKPTAEVVSVSDPIVIAPDEAEYEEDPDDSLQAALVGTVVASHAKWSTATIVDLESGKSDQYRIGDDLLGQARLVSIRSDRVILRHNGEREVLLLSEGVRVAASKDGPQDSEDTDETEVEPALRDEPEPYLIPEGMVKKTAAKSYNIDRKAVDRLLASPGDVLQSTMFTLAFDQAGHMQGVRLAIGPAGTIFRLVGLKSGDVVKRVGPVTIDSPESLTAVGQQIKDAITIDLELDRGGRSIVLRYKFD